MNDDDRLSVLLLASHCDGEDVGESFNAFKWVGHLARYCDVVLLSQYRPNRKKPSEQLKGVEVIEWPELPLFRRFERFNAIVKPWYPHYYFRARAEVRKLLASGRKFDLAHHLTPIAIRYPAPCAGLGLPYIVGPLSGGVQTPAGFEKEMGSSFSYMKLRSLDGLRLKYDPMLRHSFMQADLVVGAAPYIEHVLAPVPLRNFEVECEVGIDSLVSERKARKVGAENLRLLYVGRVIRSKGLRDAVRAIGRLPKDTAVTLTAAGSGTDLAYCQREAQELGVADKISFLGKVVRTAVEELYRSHDAFIFPSFREPTGGVVLEAMRHGLPVISSNIGGPGFIVTERSGIAVPVSSPDALADALAQAIIALRSDDAMLARLSVGARERVGEIGLWTPKIHRTLERYHRIARR